MNNKLKSGIIAGFVATLVLSGLILLNIIMGIMPRFDVVRILSDMLSIPLFAAWVVHFIIGGLLWGLLFGAFYPRIPGRSMAAKGVATGAGAWLLMAAFVMPMSGAGFIGLNAGLMAPVITLIMYLIFGVVLGTSFVRIYSELSSINFSPVSSSTLYHR